MSEGELKKRIRTFPDGKYVNVEAAFIRVGHVDEVLDEVKKEIWDCCTGFTNEYVHEIQFVRRRYHFNETALAECILKWFGTRKREQTA